MPPYESNCTALDMESTPILGLTASVLRWIAPRFAVNFPMSLSTTLSLGRRPSYRAPAFPEIQRKTAQTSGGLILLLIDQPYFMLSRACAGLGGSTQFVMPPVPATKRVIGNCGAHSTSVPLKLPVTGVPKKTAKEPSSRCTPLPPLAVIVTLANDACAPPRSTTPYPQKGEAEAQTLPLIVPPLSRIVEFKNASTPTTLFRKLELETPK
jgi:hypothetical protein